MYNNYQALVLYLLDTVVKIVCGVHGSSLEKPPLILDNFQYLACCLNALNSFDTCPNYTLVQPTYLYYVEKHPKSQL